ncbi:MAG: cyclic nucleotide-binding domain-containing protein [Rhodospirillaceae bacterium]|nr:cyclic nucleotide-binding domain-containing protein [Rhodospirillaceae bacterium]
MVSILSEDMLRGLEVKSFPASTRIFSKGDKADAAFLVVKGDVALITINAEGKNVAAGRFGPGKIFGEMAMIDEQPRRWHAVAIVETQCAVIDPSQMSARLNKIDPFMRYWIEFMSQRLMDLTSRSEPSKAGETP